MTTPFIRARSWHDSKAVESPLPLLCSPPWKYVFKWVSAFRGEGLCLISVLMHMEARDCCQVSSSVTLQPYFLV